MVTPVRRGAGAAVDRPAAESPRRSHPTAPASNLVEPAKFRPARLPAGHRERLEAGRHQARPERDARGRAMASASSRSALCA